MNIPDMGDGGVIGTIATGLTVAALAGYRAMRGIKADSRQDTTVADADARLKVERERADKFAQERMEMATSVAKLEAKFEALTEKVAILSSEKKELQAEVTELETKVSEMRSLNDKLIEELTYTKVVLETHGHADLWHKIHDHAYSDTIRPTPCAPAVISPPDPTVVARNKRLSGNKPPLAEK